MAAVVAEAQVWDADSAGKVWSLDAVLQRAFDRLDTNGDGVLDKDELPAAEKKNARPTVEQARL